MQKYNTHTHTPAPGCLPVPVSTTAKHREPVTSSLLGRHARVGWHQEHETQPAAATFSDQGLSCPLRPTSPKGREGDVSSVPFDSSLASQTPPQVQGPSWPPAAGPGRLDCPTHQLQWHIFSGSPCLQDKVVVPGVPCQPPRAGVSARRVCSSPRPIREHCARGLPSFWGCP